MKIHCKKVDLHRGLQTIQSALSNRTTLPILLNFLLETEKSRVKLVSTDLQMGMRHYIPAEIESDGSITIPARKFSDIVQSLQEGHDVDLAVEVGGRVLLKSGRSRFSLAGTPKSEYPVLPEFNAEGAFTIAGPTLAEMLKKTVFASSSDETRYVLNGVFWVGSGGALELVATDGRRLAAMRRKCLPADREFRAIIPTKVLAELLKVLGSGDNGGEDAVKIAIGDNQVAFQHKSTALLSRLVEGSFPNYEQVIPTRKDLEVRADTKELLAITRRAAVCAAERTGIVKFNFKEGILHVRAATQNQEFDEEMPVEFSGAEFAIAFNPQFLIDGLKQIDSDTVSLGITTPSNPVLIEAAGDPGYRYVVMPMRL